MHTCAACKRALPLEQFVNRQLRNLKEGKGATCSPCATARRLTGEDPERLKATEVAYHFYAESRGQVDGMNRKVKGRSVSFAALKPSEGDMRKTRLIYEEFDQHCKLENMNLDQCVEQERLRLLAALATHKELPMDQQLEALSEAAGLRAECEAVSAEQQRISVMYDLSYCEEQALSGPQLTDFISTLRDTPHGTRLPLQVPPLTSPHLTHNPNSFFPPLTIGGDWHVPEPRLRLQHVH